MNKKRELVKFTDLCLSVRWASIWKELKRDEKSKSKVNKVWQLLRTVDALECNESIQRHPVSWFSILVQFHKKSIFPVTEISFVFFISIASNIFGILFCYIALILPISQWQFTFKISHLGPGISGINESIWKTVTAFLSRFP